MVLHLVIHTKSDKCCCVKNEKQELETDSDSEYSNDRKMCYSFIAYRIVHNVTKLEGGHHLRSANLHSTCTSKFFSLMVL